MISINLNENDIIKYVIYYQPRDNKYYRLNNVKYAGLNYRGSMIFCNIDWKSTHTELDESMNEVQTCDMDMCWIYLIPEYVTYIKNV